MAEMCVGVGIKFCFSINALFRRNKLRLKKRFSFFFFFTVNDTWSIRAFIANTNSNRLSRDICMDLNVYFYTVHSCKRIKYGNVVWTRNPGCLSLPSTALRVGNLSARTTHTVYINTNATRSARHPAQTTTGVFGLFSGKKQGIFRVA